mgnify:CR=1 FL=1
MSVTPRSDISYGWAFEFLVLRAEGGRKLTQEEKNSISTGEINPKLTYEIGRASCRERV